MTTKLVRIAPNSAGLPIDPRTGKHFSSVAAWAGYEHGRRLGEITALAIHLATKGKAKGR